MTENKKGKEAYKYDKIYSRKGVFSKAGFSSTWDNANDFLKNKWDQYGHSVEGIEYIKDVLHLNPRSIIDIGCGWNEFCQIMKKNGISTATGLDCSCPGADITASAHDIPIDDKSYDLLVSFDCMEHIPKEEIPLCFQEFSRVSNRIFIKICLVDTPTRIDGEVLHSCVMPPEWWHNQAEAYFNITGILQKIGGSWPTQYMIICGQSKEK